MSEKDTTTMADTPHDDSPASANVVRLHREYPEYLFVINQCWFALANAILEAPQRDREMHVKTAAKEVALWVRIGSEAESAMNVSGNIIYIYGEDGTPTDPAR